jgi:hypothetical protein
MVTDLTRFRHLELEGECSDLDWKRMLIYGCYLMRSIRQTKKTRL